MKLKKLLLSFGALSFMLTACGEAEENKDNEPSINDGSNTNNEGTNSTTPNTDAGNTSNSNKKTANLTSSTLYIVGDSTTCNYYDSSKDSFVDDTYYYPRYGYGMEFANYLDTNYITINNLALSGKSSKTFMEYSEYNTLLNGVKEGDYVIIAFGHNDEKAGSTFTDASKPITDSTSFQYSLYENYIKKVVEKKANPILATPIVRLSTSNDYSGERAHNISTGDYKQAIIDLGIDKNVPVIDMTTITKTIYTDLGYEEARYFHAMSTVFKDDTQTELVPNINAPDQTHLNCYGAKKMAYEFSQALKKSTSALKYYVKDDITSPTKATDLVKWKNAKKTPYSAPKLSSYSPNPMYTTITEGWYGTAMGNCGGNPNSYDAGKTQSNRNGFYATETSAGTFKVGQHVYKEDSTNGSILTDVNVKGKFDSNGDGFAFAFMQLASNKAFTLSADMTMVINASQKQSGFGLMIRDDALINLDSTSGKEAVTSNYVACGFMQNDPASTSTAMFKREGGTLTKGDKKDITSMKTGDTAHLTLKRENQTIICTIVYNGSTYTQSYTDVKFNDIDENYIYVGMFGNRGTIVEFTNINFTDNGVVQEA